LNSQALDLHRVQGKILIIMKTVKIALHFRALSAVLTSVFGHTILVGMTNNLNFPNPYPVLNLLDTALTNLDNAIANQHAGDKASTATVKAAKQEVLRILKALAAHVEFESNTDEAIALSSGFSLKTIAGKAAQVFNATQGVQSGSVDLVSPATGVSYIWQYAADPIASSKWTVAAIVAQAHFTINGLTPGTKYWFSVAIVTTAGQQPASNPVMVHVV
jgi:hypothetical protein